MTRKETLLLENYRLRNEYYSLKGDTEKIVEDLDSIVNTWQFKNIACGETVYHLKSSNESLKRDIEKARLEKEHKAAADAYFATEEGQAHKEALLKEQEFTLSAMTELTENRESFSKEWIKEFLGGHWTLRCFSDSRIEFAVVDPNREDELIFGQTIEVYYDPNYWGKGERFQTNVGTTGTFNILESEQGDRARFYIDLGRFLSDRKKMEELKIALFSYKNRMEELRQIYLNIEKELANPQLA